MLYNKLLFLLVVNLIIGLRCLRNDTFSEKFVKNMVLVLCEFYITNNLRLVCSKLLFNSNQAGFNYSLRYFGVALQHLQLHGMLTISQHYRKSAINKNQFKSEFFFRQYKLFK